MRLKTADLVLLRHIQGKLISHQETTLVRQLGTLLCELEAKQKAAREANRLRAEANRRAGTLGTHMGARRKADTIRTESHFK